MSSPVSPNDIALIWAAISGISGVFLLLLGASFTFHVKSDQQALKKIDKEHDTMWAWINKQEQDVGAVALQSEKRFVTKEDLNRVKGDILERIDQSDRFMTERVRRMLTEALHTGKANDKPGL